jgi:hypothetical protein
LQFAVRTTTKAFNHTEESTLAKERLEKEAEKIIQMITQKKEDKEEL